MTFLADNLYNASLTLSFDPYSFIIKGRKLTMEKNQKKDGGLKNLYALLKRVPGRKQTWRL